MEANQPIKPPAGGDNQGEQPNQAPKPRSWEERRRDGRKNLLFSVEVLYTDVEKPGELCRHCFNNLYWDEVVDIRHDAPVIGIMHGISPGQWVQILPKRIEKIKVERQNRFREI